MYTFIKIRIKVADIITNGKDGQTTPRSQTNSDTVGTQTNIIETKANEQKCGTTTKKIDDISHSK